MRLDLADVVALCALAIILGAVAHSQWPRR